MYKIEKVFANNYNHIQHYNDIALLKLANSLQFDNQVQRISIIPFQNVGDGTKAFVTGWGKLYENGPLSEILMKVDVPIIDSKMCKKIYPFFPNDLSQICAGYQNGGKDGKI